MPLPSQSCEITTETCCTALFDIANYILNVVYEGLVGCLPLDCDGNPMPLAKYVTMGSGDDGIADSLTVAFQGSTITQNSSDGRGVTMPIIMERGEFEIRLRESGWPIVTTNGVVNAPEPAVQHAIARHAYAHIEQFRKTIRMMVAQKNVSPAGVPKPNFCQLLDLRTLNPQGGIVGCVASIRMTLPWGTQGF